MASPDPIQLEQKSRALKLKEDALNRQAHQQLKTEERIKANQEKVATKERANQVKTQDLIKREQKHKDDIFVLQGERRSFEDAQQSAATSAHRPMLEKKQQHFGQIAVASKNIDKLASILSLTQDEVVNQSSALENKKGELDKTKQMLLELKNNTDQLKTELLQLRGDHATTATEKASSILLRRWSPIKRVISAM